MSRIKELRKVIGNELRKSIADVEKLESAYAHLYGVSLAATVIAGKLAGNGRRITCRKPWKREKGLLSVLPGARE